MTNLPTVSFMFRGEGDQQIFSVRTFYDRPHQIEEKQQLLESIDDAEKPDDE